MTLTKDTPEGCLGGRHCEAEVKLYAELQSAAGCADACAGTLCAQDLHNGIQVGGVGLAGDSHTDHSGYIGNGAGECGGIGLVGLHVGVKPISSVMALTLSNQAEASSVES